MKYVVTTPYLFEEGMNETCNFFYGERDYNPLSIVIAKDKKKAGEMFLSVEYTKLINSIDRDSVNYIYEDIMQEFIDYSVEGDTVLENNHRQTEINSLADEIYDYYESLSQIKETRSNIIDISSEIDRAYRKKLTYEKFPANRLMKLLNEDEKKRAYISLLLAKLMIIPVRDL